MRPTDFSRLTNRFYVESTHIIAREDGLVEKLAGDAAAAFWGAGIAGPDYTAGTIRAAQNFLRTMHAQGIPVGIGVHVGAAFLGRDGLRGWMNISAVGGEVNTAARPASEVRAGGIIVSEQALPQAKMDGSKLGSRSLELKGISEPVTVRVMQA